MGALVSAVAARADGDPASDILYAESAFIPVDAGIPTALQLQLVALVRAAGLHGYPIKVALIGSPADLGSDTALWPKPNLYARFLGTELSLVYHGPLLIAMPNGLAIYHLDHSVGREQQILQRISIEPGGRGLATSALIAIQRLVAAAGHPLTLSHPRAPPGIQRASSIVPLAVSVASALLIALAWASSLWLRPPALTRVRRTADPSSR